MRTIILLCIATIGYTSLHAQTLFTYGNNKISKDEFMLNFNKNKIASNASRATALQQNLDLYINYKLKVQAAYDYKYDTLAKQQEELAAFKTNLEPKYLTEDKAMKALVAEAFGRMQKDINLSHIIINFTKNDSATKAQANALINEAYKKLKAGESFATVAKQYSQDPDVVTNNGNLGYITAFSLPYNMETVAYTTTKGKYSAPFASSSSYHIFYVNDVRNAIGTIKAAQILISTAPGATTEQKQEAERKINEVYTKLGNGEIFENLAKAYSTDNQSAANGGMLKDLTAGQYDPQFENKVAQLKDGELSKPFATLFGWHVVKKLSTIPVSKVLDAETTERINALIANDSRKQLAQDAFVQKLLITCNYKDVMPNKDALVQITTSKLNNQPAISTNINELSTIFTINGVGYTAKQYYEYIKTVNNARATAPTALIAQYTNAMVYAYYRNNLEKYNAEFAAQVQDFKDGNLLFEAMEQQVWSKSSTDTAGLYKYYQANKQRYTWQKSADAIIFSTLQSNTANDLYQAVTSAPNQWKEALEKYQSTAQADSGRYELNNIPVEQNNTFKSGLITQPYSPNGDGGMVFARIIKVYEGGSIKSFEDAKGLVINDYQQVLEAEWLASLKKKYPVKVNQALWNKLKAEKIK